MGHTYIGGRRPTLRSALPYLRVARSTALTSLTALLGIAWPAAAQTRDTIRVDYPVSRCASCAQWMVPHQPFRIFGNTYYVGTDGLSSILITSPAGHILIDGTLPAAAPLIVDDIRALGFRIEDVKLILNSHAHADHAGGIAALQRASHARVAATAWSAAVIRRGESDRADPQYGITNPFPPAIVDQIIGDGDTLRVGPLRLTAHLTAGHTPGGTSWTWRTCEGAICHDVLYADSQTAVSADGFLFTRSSTYPNAVADFEHGLAVLRGLPCDILLTPHPGASSLFGRAAHSALVDPAICASFVKSAADGVADRLARERRP
jgi:metallo-beta-lactamase class B